MISLIGLILTFYSVLAINKATVYTTTFINNGSKYVTEASRSYLDTFTDLALLGVVVFSLGGLELVIHAYIFLETSQ